MAKLAQAMASKPSSNGNKRNNGKPKEEAMSVEDNELLNNQQAAEQEEAAEQETDETEQEVPAQSHESLLPLRQVAFEAAQSADADDSVSSMIVGRISAGETVAKSPLSILLYWVNQHTDGGTWPEILDQLLSIFPRPQSKQGETGQMPYDVWKDQSTGLRGSFYADYLEHTHAGRRIVLCLAAIEAALDPKKDQAALTQFEERAGDLGSYFPEVENGWIERVRTAKEKDTLWAGREKMKWKARYNTALAMLRDAARLAHGIARLNEHFGERVYFTLTKMPGTNEVDTATPHPIKLFDRTSGDIEAVSATMRLLTVREFLRISSEDNVNKVVAENGNLGGLLKGLERKKPDQTGETGQDKAPKPKMPELNTELVLDLIPTIATFIDGEHEEGKAKRDRIIAKLTTGEQWQERAKQFLDCFSDLDDIRHTVRQRLEAAEAKAEKTAKAS